MWAQFDEDGTQQIAAEELPYLLQQVTPPMGVRGTDYRTCLHFCMRLGLRAHDGDNRYRRFTTARSARRASQVGPVPPSGKRFATSPPSLGSSRARGVRFPPKVLRFQEVLDALVNASFQSRKEFVPPSAEMLAKLLKNSGDEMPDAGAKATPVEKPSLHAVTLLLQARLTPEQAAVFHSDASNLYAMNLCAEIFRKYTAWDLLVRGSLDAVREARKVRAEEAVKAAEARKALHAIEAAIAEEAVEAVIAEALRPAVRIPWPVTVDGAGEAGSNAVATAAATAATVATAANAANATATATAANAATAAASAASAATATAATAANAILTALSPMRWRTAATAAEAVSSIAPSQWAAPPRGESVGAAATRLEETWAAAVKAEEGDSGGDSGPLLPPPTASAAGASSSMRSSTTAAG